MADVLGTDLAFTDDLQLTATGDFDTISGRENVRRAMLRRILTIPGTLVHRPDYGCGLLAFQNAPPTLAVRRQLAARINAQLTRDPRILSVDAVSISSEDSSPEALRVSVIATILGIGKQTFDFTPFAEVVV